LHINILLKYIIIKIKILDSNDSDYYKEKQLLPLEIRSLKETINTHNKYIEEKKNKRKIYVYDNKKNNKDKDKNKMKVGFNQIESESKKIPQSSMNNKIYKIIDLYNKTNGEFNLNLSIDKCFNNMDNTNILGKQEKENEIKEFNNNEKNSINNNNINETKDEFNSRIISNNISVEKTSNELDLIREDLKKTLNNNDDDYNNVYDKTIINNTSNEKSSGLIKLNSMVIENENENYIKYLIDLNNKKNNKKRKSSSISNNIEDNISQLQESKNKSDDSYLKNITSKSSEEKIIKGNSSHYDNNSILSLVSNQIANPVIDSSSLLINNSVKSILNISNNMIPSNQHTKSSLNIAKTNNYSSESREENKFSKLYDDLKSVSSYNIMMSCKSIRLFQEIDPQNSDYIQGKIKTPNRALRRMLFEKITNISNKKNTDGSNDNDNNKNNLGLLKKDNNNENQSVKYISNIKEKKNNNTLGIENETTNKNIKYKKIGNINNNYKKKKKWDKKKKFKKKVKKKKNNIKNGNRKKKLDKKTKDNSIKKNDINSYNNENEIYKSNDNNLYDKSLNKKISTDSIGFHKYKPKYEFDSDEEVQEYSEFEPEYLEKMNGCNKNRFTNSINVFAFEHSNNKIISAYNMENNIDSIDYDSKEIYAYENTENINNSATVNSSNSSITNLNNILTNTTPYIATSNINNHYNSTKYNNFEAIIEEDNEIDEIESNNKSNNDDDDDNLNNNNINNNNNNNKSINDNNDSDDDVNHDNNINNKDNYNDNLNNNDNTDNTDSNNNNNKRIIKKLSFSAVDKKESTER